MNINHVDDQIAAYAFGALDPIEQAQVVQHLSECAPCTGRADEAARMAALLPYAVTPYKAPLDLKQAVLARIQADSTHRPPSARSTASAQATSHDASRPPAWARPDTGTPWPKLLLHTIPWAAAVAGWAVAVILLIYSHGQSDRLRTTQQDMQSQINSLSRQLGSAQVVQGYLSTPHIKVLQMKPASASGSSTSVALVMAPKIAHGLIVARGLAVLPEGRIYQVWARAGKGKFDSVGALITGGPRADGVTLIVGHVPLEQYGVVGLSIEQAPGATQPTSPVIFSTLVNAPANS